MRTALIDADALVYAAGSANEHVTQWDADLFTLHAHLEPAKAHLDETVGHIQAATAADRVLLALSNYTNPFRRRVMPTYKAARATTRKPLVYRALRLYAQERYETHDWPGLEGDDVLGILATAPTASADEVRFTISDDKDMATVPGLHYRLRDVLRPNAPDALSGQTEGAADYAHMVQTLTGDRSDGYPGCPGIGPAKAAALLAPHFDEMSAAFDGSAAWQAVCAAYRKAGLTEADALATARVARILRYGEYDVITEQVRLWEPPQ